MIRYELIQDSEPGARQLNHKGKGLSLQRQFMPNSSSKSLLQLHVHPIRWGFDRELMERLQERNHSWLIDSQLKPEDDIVPVKAKYGKKELIIFIALNDNEKESFHPELVIPF